MRDCADQGQARGRCRRRRGRDRAEIAKDAAAGETAPTKDKLADAGGAAEDEIEAEIAKIVEETVKPSKP
ncbi:MAG TPA: hypothetical protein VGI22_25240 [Xanthobacteraceae bacterium]